MRRWGLLISAFYAIILLVLIIPGTMLLSGIHPAGPSDFLKNVREVYTTAEVWIPALLLLGSQALLLFLSVDTSEKRLRPRSHVLGSCAAAGFAIALLTSAVVWSVGFAAGGENFWDKMFDSDWSIFAFWGGLWIVWAIVFYLYMRNASVTVTQVVSWLLKGSVLELLIVVPCHIIVRRRHDCSAPIATSFGIATGIAVMLLCFGPSVLFLYKKRMDAYGNRN